MRRALSNLIDNGRRYGERVAVTLPEEPQAIVISIQDCGPGIPRQSNALRAVSAARQFAQPGNRRNRAWADHRPRRHSRPWRRYHPLAGRTHRFAGAGPVAEAAAFPQAAVVLPREDKKKRAEQRAFSSVTEAGYFALLRLARRCIRLRPAASDAPPRPSSEILPAASSGLPRTSSDPWADHHRPWRNRSSGSVRLTGWPLPLIACTASCWPFFRRPMMSVFTS